MKSHSCISGFQAVLLFWPQSLHPVNGCRWGHHLHEQTCQRLWLLGNVVHVGGVSRRLPNWQWHTNFSAGPYWYSTEYLNDKCFTAVTCSCYLLSKLKQRRLKLWFCTHPVKYLAFQYCTFETKTWGKYCFFDGLKSYFPLPINGLKCILPAELKKQMAKWSFYFCD